MKLKVRKIRVKIHAFDVKTLNACCEKIIVAVKDTNDTWNQDNLPKQILLKGPIPLPTHKKLFTVLRSPHVNKKAREQFQLSSYKRLLDIYSSSSKTIDALMKLELPSGVEVEIKV
mgnify:CR=1 FL=1